MIKEYTSKIDGTTFEYEVEDGQLSYRIEGTDWQDFIPEDKRAYETYQYNELMLLLVEGKNS
tara:strand:- start:184 stop:369 length:186 start_codon:yes stop_codon:yes gene_type:complete